MRVAAPAKGVKEVRSARRPPRGNRCRGSRPVLHNRPVHAGRGWVGPAAVPRRVYIDDWQEAHRRALGGLAERAKLPSEGGDRDVAAVLSAWYYMPVTRETLPESGAVRYCLIETLNPRGEWDWWTVGGRFPGRFPVKPGHRADPRPIETWDEVLADRVDGGPIGLLDLDASRSEAAAAAGERYDKRAALVDGLPERLPRSHFE